MASLLAQWTFPSNSLIHPLTSNRRRSPALAVTCNVKNAGKNGGTGGGNTTAVEIVVASGGLIANPIIATSLYALKTTGCGLPPGPGGAVGAAEGLSYLVVAGIVLWSLYTKARTGSGLPSGPFGLLGAAEGLSFLSLLAIVIVFGFQFLDRGFIPAPLPSDQCFG